MQAGGEFIKYGRRGYPHQRVVAITDDCSRVVWAEAGAKPRVTASRDSLDVTQITDVLDGIVTDVFARNSARVRRPECCFSVVTAARTLDLECDTPEDRERWVTAFLCLRKYGRGL